jgi:hypothetical protein
MPEKTPVHSNRRLPGKMHRWQKYTTFWLFTICFASGIIWFAALDILNLPLTQVRLWWILHGCSSLLVLLLIGAALPQHLVVTWKARRNIRHGILVLAGLLALLLSALCLLYGAEQWHDGAHWTHSVLGLLVALIFPLHVWRGRRHHPQPHSA